MHQKIIQTKQRIHCALIELLKVKSLHLVTICELCDLAQIHRSTFYKHYGSQYDVLNEIGTMYLDEVAQCIEMADAHDKQSVLDAIERMLHYMIEHIETTKLLFNNNTDPDFAQKLFSLPKIDELLNASLSETDTLKRKNITSFAIFGSWKLLLDWINNEKRISERKQAELILLLAGKVCH